MNKKIGKDFFPVKIFRINSAKDIKLASFSAEKKQRILPIRLTTQAVLGNKVSTLVNKEKHAGVYEVEFSTFGGKESSIQNPASGIYFYQLRAGDFIQTKKMILLK